MGGGEYLIDEGKGRRLIDWFIPVGGKMGCCDERSVWVFC
jgi:hypothetical protein